MHGVGLHAHAAWKEAGCPTEGPLFEEKDRLCWSIRERVRFCATQSLMQRA